MKSQGFPTNEKKEYSIVNYIKKRISDNKNFITAITGPTGSGKSWTALSMGELLDERFNIDRVVFKARELMTLINSEGLSAGSVIVWDEAGIDLSNRNWQSSMNKVINYLLQTFRHKNFILIFTVPYSDFIDSASRKLFHGEFLTVGINRRRSICIIKPKMLQYNSTLKKWYVKYIKVKKGGKGVIKIKRWSVPKPSEEIIKQYEEKKNNFTKDLNKDIEEMLIEDNDKKDRGYKIRYIHRDVYLAWHLVGKSNSIVAKCINAHPPNVSRVFRVMDKKYPEWRNDDTMLGDIKDLKHLSLLCPSKLNFIDKLKK